MSEDRRDFNNLLQEELKKTEADFRKRFAEAYQDDSVSLKNGETVSVNWPVLKVGDDHTRPYDEPSKASGKSPIELAFQGVIEEFHMLSIRIEELEYRLSPVLRIKAITDPHKHGASPVPGDSLVMATPSINTRITDLIKKCRKINVDLQEIIDRLEI